MAQRLLLIAYAPTVGARELVFGGGDGAVVGEVPALAGRVARWVCGPEPVGRATAARLGAVDAEVLTELRNCDFGSWSGLTLNEVGALDPGALAGWLADPRARPHGGETLAELVGRVGRVMDGQPWPHGRSVAVVPPLVARAALLHTLSVPPEAIFRVDVAPLGRVTVSRAGAGWRLQELSRA
jgi:broad specificity phosphatase PhoE